MDQKCFVFSVSRRPAVPAAPEKKAGVCGKTADVAKLQDELTGALIGAGQSHGRRYSGSTADTWRLMIEGLFTTVTNVNFNEETIRALIDRVHAEKGERLVPGAGCGFRLGGMMITI